MVMDEFEDNATLQKVVPVQCNEFQRHWFCVALFPSGGTYKQDADSPTEFLEILCKAEVAWVDYWTEDYEKDVAAAASELGFSDLLISSFSSASRLNYQDFETEMGIRYPSIQVREFEVEIKPLLLLMRKNFVATFHSRTADRRFTHLRRYSDIVLKKIRTDLPEEDKLSLLLVRIIDETNERNFDHLRQIEERGDELNKDMMDPNTPRSVLGPKIYEMKHAVITYSNGLWESIDVLHELRYGDARLITDNPKLLTSMSLLEEDVSRQISLAEHMSEVLASGLEVLQSIYNNQLQVFNNRLALVVAYLTIVGTAVLVPNTLATVMGSSAFDLQPEDKGWYIALLVVSTILATALTYWWVRMRGWIPKKMD